MVETSVDVDTVLCVPHKVACWARSCASFASLATTTNVPDGVSVEIDKKGNMKLEDRNHRKRVYEALGRFDYSAGMSGDPAPNGDHYAMQRESREQEKFWQGIDEKVAAYEQYFGIS